MNSGQMFEPGEMFHDVQSASDETGAVQDLGITTSFYKRFGKIFYLSYSF